MAALCPYLLGSGHSSLTLSFHPTCQRNCLGLHPHELWNLHLTFRGCKNQRMTWLAGSMLLYPLCNMVSLFIRIVVLTSTLIKDICLIYLSIGIFSSVIITFVITVSMHREPGASGPVKGTWFFSPKDFLNLFF